MSRMSKSTRDILDEIQQTIRYYEGELKVLNRALAAGREPILKKRKSVAGRIEAIVPGSPGLRAIEIHRVAVKAGIKTTPALTTLVLRRALKRGHICQARLRYYVP